MGVLRLVCSRMAASGRTYRLLTVRAESSAATTDALPRSPAADMPIAALVDGLPGLDRARSRSPILAP